MSAPELRGADRWATVPRHMAPSTAAHRHIVAKGAVTSVCGTTALPVTLWRGNSTKPVCPSCVAKYTPKEG